MPQNEDSREIVIPEHLFYALYSADSEEAGDALRYAIAKMMGATATYIGSDAGIALGRVIFSFNLQHEAADKIVAPEALMYAIAEH